MGPEVKRRLPLTFITIMTLETRDAYAPVSFVCKADLTSSMVVARIFPARVLDGK